MITWGTPHRQAMGARRAGAGASAVFRGTRAALCLVRRPPQRASCQISDHGAEVLLPGRDLSVIIDSGS